MRTYTDIKQQYGPGYVYVIKDESERRKIGLAEDVDHRLKELQTGNAERLIIEYRLAVANMKHAEGSLHNLFAANRLRSDGEWFKLTEAQLQLLRKIFGAHDITKVEESQFKILGFR